MSDLFTGRWITPCALVTLWFSRLCPSFVQTPSFVLTFTDVVCSSVVCSYSCEWIWEGVWYMSTWVIHTPIKLHLDSYMHSWAYDFVSLWCKICQKYCAFSCIISPVWSQAVYLYGLWRYQMFLRNCSLFFHISVYWLNEWAVPLYCSSSTL